MRRGDRHRGLDKPHTSPLRRPYWISIPNYDFKRNTDQCRWPTSATNVGDQRRRLTSASDVGEQRRRWFGSINASKKWDDWYSLSEFRLFNLLFRINSIIFLIFFYVNLSLVGTFISPFFFHFEIPRKKKSLRDLFSFPLRDFLFQPFQRYGPFSHFSFPLSFSKPFIRPSPSFPLSATTREKEGRFMLSHSDWLEIPTSFD